MKTTIESYQNQTKNLQNLTNLQLDDLYSSVYTLIGEAIENDDLESHDKILPILRAIKKEIQDRNEVTPATTEDKSNRERIKTQINQTIKKRTRNNITFEYALFLHTVRKITTEKFLLIANKKRVKTDTLRRVHTLLVYEHNRLNKVA
jgi:hypothetical protein